MNNFKPKNSREKWLSVHFDTKQSISDATNLSLPTIDKICSDEEIFYKYVPKIAKALNLKAVELLQQYWRITNGL